MKSFDLCGLKGCVNTAVPGMWIEVIAVVPDLGYLNVRVNVCHDHFRLITRTIAHDIENGG